MVLFEEYFPSEKSAIEKYAQRQKKLEELSFSLRNTESSSNDRLSSKTSMFPHKPSFSEVISEIHRDTEDKLRQSSEVDMKLEEIHRMIENVDDIKFIMEPDMGNIGSIGSEDDNQAAESLQNSSEPGDNEILKDPTIDDLRKFSENISDVKSKSIPNRVMRLEQIDSALEISDYKLPKIKPTRASILKSKFYAEKSQKVSATSKNFQKHSTSESLQRTSRTSSFTKFEAPKKVDSKKMNKSVRKILDDAKEKHKARNSIKSNVPVNVVDLFLA